MAKKKQKEPQPTGRYYHTDQCPRCNGQGRIPPRKKFSGWQIDYHYQDGHEVSAIMSKEEAIKRMDGEEQSVMKTLIGPDGQIYTI